MVDNIPVHVDPARPAAPTLEQVAERAGVSRSTASRAINGGLRVSPEALASVEAAVDRPRVHPEPRRTLAGHQAHGLDRPGGARARRARAVRPVLRGHPERPELLARRLGHAGRARHRPPGRERAHRPLPAQRSRRRRDRRVAPRERRARPGAAARPACRTCSSAGRCPPTSATCSTSTPTTSRAAGSPPSTSSTGAAGASRRSPVRADMSAGIDRLTGWRNAIRAAGMSDDAVVRGDFTMASGTARGARAARAVPRRRRASSSPPT